DTRDSVETSETGRQTAGETMDRTRDLGQTLGPVPDRVQAGDHREQDLCRADIRRRPLPPDVLLSGLEGQAIAEATFAVGRDADQPSGEGAHVLLSHGDETRMRSPETHRHSESLRRSDGD